MFKKIAYFGFACLAIIASFVFANPHHGDHGGLTLPPLPIPTIHINTGGLLALLRQPPIPVVSLPPFRLPNLPIPMISLPTSGPHGHHGGHHGLPELPIGDLINGLFSGSHDSWDSWA